MGLNLQFLISAKAIATYWQETEGNFGTEYLGTKYFPNAKQTGLELSWIKGRNNLPVALKPSVFDTKAALRDRIGVTHVSTEMPFFREAMRVCEKDRQDIETLLAKGFDFAAPLVDKIFDDAGNLINGALVQGERMRMSLLSGGTIAIEADAEDGRPIRYLYDYDAGGDWASTNTRLIGGRDSWNANNVNTANPLEDLAAAAEALATTKGVKAVEVIMNSTTFGKMMNTASVRAALSGVPFYSSSVVKDFISAELGLTITIYDRMFKDEQGNDRKYFPDNVCTLVPGYALGNTWYGTTPEEFDLMSGSDAEVAIVNTGVAVTTIKEPHPVNVQTIVSEIVLPSFEKMDDIFVLNTDI